MRTLCRNSNWSRMNNKQKFSAERNFSEKRIFLINCITFTFVCSSFHPEWLWIYDTLGCVCRAEQQIFDRKPKGTRTVNAILITVIIQMVVPYLFHSNRRPLETFISIQEGASETAAAGSTVYREQGNKYQLHIRSAFVSRRAQIFIGSWKCFLEARQLKQLRTYLPKAIFLRHLGARRKRHNAADILHISKHDLFRCE